MNEERRLREKHNGFPLHPPDVVEEIEKLKASPEFQSQASQAIRDTAISVFRIEMGRAKTMAEYEEAYLNAESILRPRANCA